MAEATTVPKAVKTYLSVFDDKIRPFVQPAMFGYLAYFYTQVSQEAIVADQGELSRQTLVAMNQYGMILSFVAALMTLASFLATWFDDPCPQNGAVRYSKTLQLSTNPLTFACVFQLLAIYVVGHALQLPRYTNAESDEHGAESVAAGVITLLSCLTAYMSVDSKQGEEDTNNGTTDDAKKTLLETLLTSIVGEKRTHDMLASMVSGILILIAWSYNISKGAFVGPWYEAFTVMILAVLINFGLGIKGATIDGNIRQGINLMFHVLIIYFLAKHLGTEADNFVALALVIASAVLSVSSHPAAKDRRLNAKFNSIASLILRVVHAAVAVVAWLAVDEMTAGNDVLHALIKIGVLLKLVSCFLPVSQLEFLMRNASTLILLLPLAALQTDYEPSDEPWQFAAFILVVTARAVDAVQNTLTDDDTFELGKLGSEIPKNIAHLPRKPAVDNPLVYVIAIGVITTSIGLVYGGNEACEDGILDPSATCTGLINGTQTQETLTEHESTVVRLAIALVWTHAVSIVIGTISAMLGGDPDEAKVSDDRWYKILGYFSPSTWEFFRTTVATTVLGLLSYAAYQSGDTTASDSLLTQWVYLSLFSYIFVDTLGRNVV